MVDDVLYEDKRNRIKITYLHSPEPGKEKEVISVEEQELWIKDKNNEWNRYIFQRGILESLSRIVNDDSRLINMLNRINPFFLEGMRKDGINLEEISIAILEAYQKRENEFKKYLVK